MSRISKNLVFGLILVTSFVFSQNANAFDPCKPENYTPVAERYKSGLLFEVQKCGILPSYVFGTMHSDMVEILKILPPVFEKIRQSKSVNFELKSDGNQLAEVMQVMYYDADSPTNLETVIGTELYAKLKAIMDVEKPDIPEFSYRRMKPWAVAIIMQYPSDTYDGVYTDLRLENYAKEREVEIFGLETPAEQLSIFTEMSDENQIEFLRETIENFSLTDEINDQLVYAYLAQDLGQMQELAKQAMDSIESEEFKELFLNKMIYSRNKLMVERSAERLAGGATFIAVGALHLAGEKGILALLEENGYYINVAE